jgi:hypothetical protein
MKKPRFDNICPRCGERPRAKHPKVQGRYCGPCKAAKSKEDREKNPERSMVKMQRAKLKEAFGLTIEQFEEIEASQGGVCAICRLPEKAGRRSPASVGPFAKFKRRLCVDHDHDTGKIRGLLCAHCNTGLGHFGDSIETLSAAIQYLRERKGRKVS